jgi:hypothetical protein
MFGTGLAGRQGVEDTLLEWVDDENIPLREQLLLGDSRWIFKASQEHTE